MTSIYSRNFRPRFYSIGSMVFTFISWFVGLSVCLKISHKLINVSEILHKVGGQYSKKSDTTWNFENYPNGVMNGNYLSKIGVLGHFLGNRSLKISDILHDGRR